MNKPIFIISFDCEGKWGMIDHLSDEYAELLSNKRLNQAYLDILKIMELYEIRGTFAFVGALTLSIEEYNNRRDYFKEVLINGKSWINRFLLDSEKSFFDGWLNPRAFEIVKSKKIHEIASHSFTHLPLSEKLISKKDFIDEMTKMKKVMELKNQEINTFIYPRNNIGFTSELDQFGIKGYRENLFQKNNNLFGKIKSFSSEFNIFQHAQNHSTKEKLIKIPAGYFLNWRYNHRKKVPISLTIKRWESIIKNAIKNNSVVHLWTHPHNFINGHQQFELFDKVLKLVSKARDEKKINILTQEEYCKRLSKF